MDRYPCASSARCPQPPMRMIAQVFRRCCRPARPLPLQNHPQASTSWRLRNMKPQLHSALPCRHPGRRAHICGAGAGLRAGGRPAARAWRAGPHGRVRCGQNNTTAPMCSCSTSTILILSFGNKQLVHTALWPILPNLRAPTCWCGSMDDSLRDIAAALGVGQHRCSEAE